MRDRFRSGQLVVPWGGLNYLLLDDGRRVVLRNECLYLVLWHRGSWVRLLDPDCLLGRAYTTSMVPT